MEGHDVPADVTAAQVQAARNLLIATYRNAVRESDAAPMVERIVLRSAVAVNSAAAAHQLATGWSADMAGPMEQFADEAKRDDLLGRSMWPGSSILLAHLGVARVLLAILLGVAAWLLRTSMLPEVVQIIICLLLLVVMVYLLGAPISLYEKADEVDSRITQLVDPAQREFFELAGGSPPMMEPAKLVKTSVRGAARLLLLGFLGLILAPLVASVVSVVRSMLSTGG